MGFPIGVLIIFYDMIEIKVSDETGEAFTRRRHRYHPKF